MQPKPPAAAEVEQLGIECTDCGCRHFEVIRVERLTNRIRRRRECRNCGRRVTTIERVAGSLGDR